MVIVLGMAVAGLIALCGWAFLLLRAQGRDHSKVMVDAHQLWAGVFRPPEPEPVTTDDDVAALLARINELEHADADLDPNELEAPWWEHTDADGAAIMPDRDDIAIIRPGEPIPGLTREDV